MLDFAFGPNGYGLTEGMRKEQDRITQNRSQFANNMATFLANNPYISPEAAQAFINSAAGTDNTLRGSVPNQLIGELNKENTRKRRIDTFQAFNEFTRLNPGASAAEFQSAMSALGAQGIYGADALKAIQGRADQYRKDQDTKRLYTEAQNIGQLRTQLMADAKSIFIQNGYDVEKTKKQLESIYGKNTPVPIDSIVNPGMATTLKSDLVREYVPRAVEVMNKNPDITPEMLYGLWPELQGSPVIKAIYDSAQTERKKTVQSNFDTNSEKIIQGIVTGLDRNLDLETAYEMSARAAGVSAQDLKNLDGSRMKSAATAAHEKAKAGEEQKLEGILNSAKGKMFGEIRTNTLADPVTMQKLASGDIGNVVSFVRSRVQGEYGLALGMTNDQISKIPDSYYQSLAAELQQQLIGKMGNEQASLYDKVHGQSSELANAIRSQNAKIAEEYTKPSIAAAIANSGLDKTVSGAVIPSIISGVSQTHDLSNGGADRLFEALLQIASKNPDAGSAIRDEAIKLAQLQPITAVVNNQIDTLAKRSGAVSRVPVPATQYVDQELLSEAKSVDAQIGQVKSIAGAKDRAPEDIVADLSVFRAQVEASIAANPDSVIGLLQNSNWSTYGDRFSETHVKRLLDGYGAKGKRLLDFIDSTIASINAQNEAQRRNNMAPAELRKRPDTSDRSPLWNSVVKPFTYTDDEAKMSAMQNEIVGNLPAYPDVNIPFIGGIINKFNPSNIGSSQAEMDLTNKVTNIVNDPVAMAIIYKNPEIYALINPNSQSYNPQEFLRVIEAEISQGKAAR